MHFIVSEWLVLTDQPFLFISFIITIFVLCITKMNKEHMIIENKKALADYGCKINSNLVDECNNRVNIVHEIIYPYYLLN